MEWVETTGKTIEDARELALDQLGVAADDAEFEVLESPRPGLFGRMRGEARLKARVRPTQVRPKQERRRRGKSDKASVAASDGGDEPTPESPADDTPPEETSAKDTTPKDTAAPKRSPRPSAKKSASSNSSRQPSNPKTQEQKMTDERPETTVTPDEVGAAAVTFMDGLTSAFGATGTCELTVDELELEVKVTGAELGLLVGPGGRTLNAIQDLARVAAQRRLGDHETRLRIDVAGYRERREAALASFARDVAEQVRTSGTARSLEPMASSDRKVIHDVLNEEEGVASRSVGEDPDRRIIVEPA